MDIEEPVTVPQQSIKKRSKLLLVGSLCLLALIVCLLQAHYYSVDALKNQAKQAEYISQRIIARPGDIVDRKGRLLATSISAKSLYLVPKNIKSPQQTAQALSTLLDIDTDWVARAIENQQKGNRKYLWLQHRLNRKEVQQVHALGLPEDVYGFQKEYLRCYPRGNLAAHLLGTQNIDGTSQGGIEEYCQIFLRGENGKRLLLRNANREEASEKGGTSKTEIIQAPQHGKTIVLAIDAEIQLFVEQELQQVMLQRNPQGCCAIVMNPKTGEILASASFPQYDPNRPTAISFSAWRDQTISFLFEPGSILNPLIAAWGLEKGVVSKDQTSNNAGLQQIAKRLQNKRLYEAVVQFGLGKKTDCILPNEQSGNILPLDQWESSSGKPSITVTPLRLITAYAALANGGKVVSPRYVLQQVNAIDYIRNELSATSEEKKPILESGVTANQMMAQENANWIITKPMVDLVNEGTGKEARLHGYSVFGYPGTSQKHLPLTGITVKEKDVCSFICGAPADDPCLLVLVVIDEPAIGNRLTGGTVAAPVAAKILHKSLIYLQVPTLRTRVQAAAEKSLR